MYQRLSRQLGWRSWWWEWRILWRCWTQNRVTLGWRHSKNRIQVMRIHRIHKLLQVLHRRARAQEKGKADKRSKKPTVLFRPEQEQKLVDFLRNNVILYNKHLMDYKDRSKKEAVWAKFCEEINLDKDACQKWFQSQRTLLGKVTHMKSGQGELVLTERQKWTRDNFDFFRDHIMCHLTAKREFRAPKGFCFSSQCSSELVIQTGDCPHGTIPGYFSSKVNL